MVLGSYGFGVLWFWILGLYGLGFQVLGLRLVRRHHHPTSGGWGGGAVVRTCDVSLKRCFSTSNVLFTVGRRTFFIFLSPAEPAGELPKKFPFEVFINSLPRFWLCRQRWFLVRCNVHVLFGAPPWQDL